MKWSALQRLRSRVRARADAVWTRDRAQLRGGAALAHRFARIAILVVRGVIAHRLKFLVGALTYCTVFSLVPLLVVVFMSLRLLDLIPAAIPFLSKDSGGGFFDGGNMLLRLAAGSLLDAVDRTTEITSGVVGLIILLYAIGRLFGYTERALYIIAGSEQRTPRLSRIFGYLALLALPPVVVTLSGLLVAAKHDLFGGRVFRALGAVPGLDAVIGAGVGLGALWLALAIFYSSAVRARIAFSSAAVGAAFAAVTLPLVLWAFAELQIGVSQESPLEAGLLAVPVFLLWLSSFWYVVLLGAEIAVAHGVDRVLVHGAGAFRLDCMAEGRAGLGLMVLVARAPNVARVTTDSLARELRLPPHLVRDLGARLVGRGLLRAEVDGFSLACNPDETKVETVLDAVARDPALDTARSELLVRVQLPAGQQLARDVTLRQLATGAGAPPP